MDNIRDILSGKVPLWKIYWVYGGLGGIIFKSAGTFFDKDAAQQTIISILSVTYAIVVGIGIWRSSTSYKPAGKIDWGVVAKFVICVVVCGQILSLLRLFGLSF